MCEVERDLLCVFQGSSSSVCVCGGGGRAGEVPHRKQASEGKSERSGVQAREC